MTGLINVCYEEPDLPICKSKGEFGRKIVLNLILAMSQNQVL